MTSLGKAQKTVKRQMPGPASLTVSSGLDRKDNLNNNLNATNIKHWPVNEVGNDSWVGSSGSSNAISSSHGKILNE